MVNFIERYLELTPDPGAAEFFIVRSPLFLVAILTFYTFFVKKWGPSLMKNRQGFELRGLLIIYNSLQVGFNAYIVYKCIPMILNEQDWLGRCLRMSPESSKLNLWLGHAYCVLKLIDLLDTVFFVLRKRYNQVTFLHFYHHISVSPLSIIVFKYAPNGHLGLVGFVNTCVHVVMYFYYLLSSFQPNIKNSIWWKKYITLLQILQFVFLTSFILYPWLNGEQCGYPLKLLPLTLVENLIMLVLFSNFYIKNYMVKPKLKV